VSDDGLALSYRLRGDVSRLRIPGPAPPKRVDGLWRSTCFEAFVMAGRGPAYREFNFSPSGEWAVYDFRAWRDGGALDVAFEPDIVLRQAADGLELDATIDVGHLARERPWHLGLSAVIEEDDGVLSFWALRHPAGRPDFHHADGFVARVG